MPHYRHPKRRRTRRRDVSLLLCCTALILLGCFVQFDPTLAHYRYYHWFPPQPPPQQQPNYSPHRPDQDLTAPVADWDVMVVKTSPMVHDATAPSVQKLASKYYCQKHVLPLDTTPPIRRTPTHTACKGYKGVLWIQQGDRGGASGTIFFVFVSSMLAWADQHDYLPYIHMDDQHEDYTRPIYDAEVHGRQGVDQTFTMMRGMRIGDARDADDAEGYIFPGRPVQWADELHPYEYRVKGTGVWEHYFQPVSDFVPGDKSCTTLPLVQMDWTNLLGIHSQAPWTPRANRYTPVKKILQEEKSLGEWLESQRDYGTAVVSRYIRFNAALLERIRCIFPDPSQSLGLHIRHTDKISDREYVPVDTFKPYAEAFVNHGGRAIFLATDSQLVVDDIMTDWPTKVTSRIVRPDAVRSASTTATFDLGKGAHRTNTEALAEIGALASCTFLIHGLSAFTEAVFYLNPDLQKRAINLDLFEIDDDTKKLELPAFKRMLHKEFKIE